MLRVVGSTVVFGSTSKVSPEDIFRGGKKQGRSFSDINASNREDKRWEHADRQCGRSCSISPKLGGSKKVSPVARPSAHGSATLVRLGEHVPQDFGAEWLVPYDVDAEKFRALTGAPLLAWFESTDDGKTSLESLQRLREQAAITKENVLGMAGIERAVHGSNKEYNDAVQAATRNDEAVKAAETAHYDRAHMKHMLANKANTGKVVTSIMGELLKPGEHLAARQTPKAIRAITTDKNGKVTGSPSASRIVVDGNKVLAEAIDATEDEVAADKKESAGQNFQKTSDGLAQIRLTEEKVAFLSSEVERLKSEDAVHGLGDKQKQDLRRLTIDLKATQTRLNGKIDPVREHVRLKGVKVITDNASGKKAGTITCPKHAGKLNCQCHREVLLDKSRGITKRSRA